MKKICSKCGKEKEISEFRKEKKCKDGYKSCCKTCDYGHEPHNKNVLTKVCKCCGEEKSIEEFQINNISKGYRHSYCKKCKNKMKQLKRSGTSEEAFRDRRKRLKRNYNISPEDYNQMVLSQNGLCKICGGATKLLVVDHNHATGKVRGLLCNNCNSLLGFSKDNIDTLLSAIEYLKEDKSFEIVGN